MTLTFIDGLKAVCTYIKPRRETLLQTYLAQSNTKGRPFMEAQLNCAVPEGGAANDCKQPLEMTIPFEPINS